MISNGYDAESRGFRFNMINFVQMDERTEKYELCYADDYIMSLSMRCNFIKINNYELFSGAIMIKEKYITIRNLYVKLNYELFNELRPTRKMSFYMQLNTL